MARPAGLIGMLSAFPFAGTIINQRQSSVMMRTQ
jgi:hypothetical protein